MAEPFLSIRGVTMAFSGVKALDKVDFDIYPGEVHCLASITPVVPRGVVSLPKGLWRKSTRNGATANSLAPDTLSDLGGGACFNDARVEVTRMLDAEFGSQRLSLWVETTPPPRAQ